MLMKLYTKLPKGLQGSLRSLMDRIPLPYRYGPKFIKVFDEVQKWGTWSAEQLREYQDSQLQKMIHHCYDNVPYYRNLFEKHNLTPDDIKTKTDLAKLPITTKAEMIANFDALTAKNKDEFNPIIMSTSGTTGTPFKFYQDEKNILYERAFVLRYFGMSGMRPNDLLAILRSYVPEKGQPLWKRYGSWIYFSAYDMTPENMRKYYEKIKNMKIKYLRGYPTSVFAFAKFIRDEGLDLKLNGVFTSSETLFDNYRDMVREAFGCEVYDLYGSGEHVAFLDQCHIDGQTYYHENPEYSVTELVDDKGNPVTEEGAQGRVVGTSLHSFSMPFLRYQISDYAVFTKEKCPCGKPLIAKKILGRVDDYLTTPNGKIVSAVNFYTVFYKTPHVSQFQIIQNTLEDVDINIVVEDQFDQEIEAKLLENLYSRLDRSMSIHINRIKEIPRDKNSDKVRCIISKVR